MAGDGSLRGRGNEDCELEDDDEPWEHVVVDDDVEVVQHCEPEGRQHVCNSAAVVGLILFLLFLESVPDFLEGILILADGQPQVTRCVLNLVREVLREHVVDLDDETQCHETLDDHGEGWGLTHCKYKHDFSAER